MNNVDGELKVFAPILIQQYVRMQTAAHYINSDCKEKKTKFKISSENYKKMTDEPLQAMLIGLEMEYDKDKEILTVCPDAEFIDEFQNNIMHDVALQYAKIYDNRYASVIKVAE